MKGLSRVIHRFDLLGNQSLPLGLSSLPGAVFAADDLTAWAQSLGLGSGWSSFGTWPIRIAEPRAATAITTLTPRREAN